jgi:hypothetical protein
MDNDAPDIFAALDKAAVALLAIAAKEEAPEGDDPGATIGERVKAFDAVWKYAQTRSKTLPSATITPFQKLQAKAQGRGTK